MVPKAQRLDYTIVPAQTDAHGHIGIDAEVRRPTRVVWLSATDLVVTAATLNGAPARVVAGGDSFVGLTTDRELAVGPLAIEADFASHIDHAKSRGLYAEKEGAEDYAYTFFEAVDARRAFPCFDEPAYKIPWQLTFHVKKEHVALANAPVTAEADEAGGMKRVTIAVSKPLPSYLVAFVVGPFEVVDGGTGGRAHTPIRFVIPKGRAGELGYAKEITPKIVAALEDYFDMAYPYVKLDVAVVPRFWGTMEHPGLLAMGQPLTLIRPDQATRDRREAYANTASHELSHYWFGDYVTMAWWDDTWLNEAQGEWLDALITDAVAPDWRYELTRVSRARSAMDADETLATQRIRHEVKAVEDIEGSFDSSITYLKGSSVLRMFEAYVGHDAWQTFIRGYVREHAWGNAAAEDMFRAVGAKLGAPVEAGLRSFIDQPGVPRIGMTLDCSAKGKPALVLHQTRALPAGIVDPAPHLWSVPVCVRYGGETGAGARACVLLAAADGRLELPGACPTWIVPNAGGVGYYRSAPADTKVEIGLVTPGSRIARLAKPTPAERIMIVADLRAAVDRDELSIGDTLALVPHLVTDPDVRVARQAGRLGAFRTDALGDDLHARAIRFWLSVNKPLVQRLGWRRRPGDSDDVQDQRRDALGAAYWDPKLAAEATRLALRWFDDRTAIDDDLLDAVLADAAFHGNAALFDKLLARAKAPRDRSEAERLINVLGVFSDPALEDRALALVLGTELDLRDSTSILSNALAGRTTRPRSVAFVEAHLDEILARMRDDEASWVLGALADTACDAPTRDRIAALVVPRAPKHPGSQQVVDRGLALSNACIATFARQLPALEAFLSTK